MRLALYLLAVWFLVSIPVALFIGRVCRLCSDSSVCGSGDGTDLATIRAQCLADAASTVGSTQSDSWQGSESAVRA